MEVLKTNCHPGIRGRLVGMVLAFGSLMAASFSYEPIRQA